MDMMSIGTLIEYSLLNICVIVLRYRASPELLADPKYTIEQFKIKNGFYDKYPPSARSQTLHYKLWKICFKPTKICTETSSCLVNIMCCLECSAFNFD